MEGLVVAPALRVPWRGGHRERRDGMLLPCVLVLYCLIPKKT